MNRLTKACNYAYVYALEYLKLLCTTWRIVWAVLSAVMGILVLLWGKSALVNPQARLLLYGVVGLMFLLAVIWFCLDDLTVRNSSDLPSTYNMSEETLIKLYNYIYKNRYFSPLTENAKDLLDMMGPLTPFEQLSNKRLMDNVEKGRLIDILEHQRNNRIIGVFLDAERRSLTLLFNQSNADMYLRDIISNFIYNLYTSTHSYIQFTIAWRSLLKRLEDDK